MKDGARSEAYAFHPLEISFIGYSGAGKTTLIERLLGILKESWKLGYIKHDAHSFDVDKPGKDSHRARVAGASSTYIASASRTAWMVEGQLPSLQQRSLFLDCDALIVEGYKNLHMDKLVVIDAEAKLLDALPPSAWERVLGFVGEGPLPPCALPLDRPYWSRDAVAEIAAFVSQHWLEKARRSRPLRGLVLAGGRSVRMGQDKGLMRYRGEAQALWAWRLLESLGVPSFVSLRREQWPERGECPCIDDMFEDVGPLGGIVSAMQRVPDASWLVLACDLPLVTGDVLQHLLEKRQVHKAATAYRAVGREDLPEPLCAIYEAPLRVRFYEALALGMHSVRDVLKGSNLHLLDAPDPRALSNVNDPIAARAVFDELRGEA